MKTPATTKMTFAILKAMHETYFNLGNKKFFKDISYKVIHIKGIPFLITYTYGFSGQLTGQPPVAGYTAKQIMQGGKKIGQMIDRRTHSHTFSSVGYLKEFIAARIMAGMIKDNSEVEILEAEKIK